MSGVLEQEESDGNPNLLFVIDEGATLGVQVSHKFKDITQQPKATKTDDNETPSAGTVPFSFLSDYLFFKTKITPSKKPWGDDDSETDIQTTPRSASIKTETSGNRKRNP